MVRDCWIELNPIQPSIAMYNSQGSTIKTITRTQLEVTLHAKYTEGFLLSLREAVFLH